MYHAIVKRIAHKNFLLVNRKDFGAILSACVPSIRHQFGGAHALGGKRHDREALGQWFGRLGRLCPHLTLTVDDIWVKGLPHNTTVIVRWSATDTLPDGSPYRNRGVHIIKMRWGKVVDIDAHEDSQAVAESMTKQAALGIAEATAAQILS